MTFGQWIVFLAFVAISSASLAAPPTTQPTRPGYRLVAGQWTATTRIESWQKFASVSLVDGLLQADLSLDDKLARQFTAGRRVAAEVGDSPLVWIITYSEFNAGDVTRRGKYLRAGALPAAPMPDDRYRLSAVIIEPAGIVIRGAGKMDNRDVTCELMQDRVKNFLSLRITDTVPGEQPRGLQANAVDLRMLLLEHGGAMQAYVVPLLNELSGTQMLRPRAADVYRIFPDIPATAEGNAGLKPILDALTDRDPKVRQAAEGQLDASSDDVILAAMRAQNLNPTAHAAIQSFLRRRAILLESQIDRMRDEVPYQIELLDFDDRAVRERAKARIERLTDEKIKFDLDLEGTQRSAAVDELRARFTQPLY